MVNILYVLLSTLAQVSLIIQGRLVVKEAVYNLVKGIHLKDHVISTHHVASPIDCSFLCTSTEKCKSYNYKTRITGNDDLCQLNNATGETTPSSIEPDGSFNHFTSKTIFSDCLAYFKEGVSQNGVYVISDSQGNPFPVYCDFTSERRSAWTLIMSQSFKMSYMPEFCSKELSFNAPVKENHPNWKNYRLSLNRMSYLSNVSSHVRITTDFATSGVDFKDYLRAAIADINILQITGSPVCKSLDYINVRENIGESISAPLYQNHNHTSIFHVRTDKDPCLFDAKSGAVPSERNFGMYCSNMNHTNRDFRGTANPDSTTEYWFGGYL